MTRPTEPPPLAVLREPHHVELRARLASASDRVIARALSDQYADPFWRARYGERADRRGTEDGRFHLAYLDQALASDDLAVLTHYARWLQPILTSRGMCTRHIVEHFDRLQRAIAAERWPDGHLVASAIHSLVGALSFPSMWRTAPRVRSRTRPTSSSSSRHRSSPRSIPDTRTARPRAWCCSRRTRRMRSRSAALVAHARWLLGYSTELGLPPTYVHDLLAALRETFDDVTPVTAAASVLDDAIAVTLVAT